MAIYTNIPFRIATRDHKDPLHRKGYVMGQYASHKEILAIGWTVTHLPSGLAIA